MSNVAWRMPMPPASGTRHLAFGIWHLASGIRIFFGFSGKEWDPDAQLYYFGFRWYDPDTGTWTTKDPLTYLSGELNLYTFSLNRALTLVDPYGLATTGLDPVSIQDPQAWERDFPEIADLIRQVQESNRCYINSGWDKLGNTIKGVAHGIADIIDYTETLVLYAIDRCTDWLIERAKDHNTQDSKKSSNTSQKPQPGTQG